MLLILAIVVIMPAVSAAEWTLNPGDSIEANISLASPGDTLVLNPGTYRQFNITVSKDITVKSNSSSGGSASDTIIDAMGSGTVFYENSSGGHTLTVEGLGLKNGSAGYGGAICTINGVVVISYSDITDCSTPFMGQGGAIYSSGGNVIATSCTFTDCSSNTGGAICSPVVNATSCTFTRCGSSICLGGAISSDDVTAISCSFTGCFAWAGGGICSDTVTARSCTFTDCVASTYTDSDSKIHLGVGGAISSDDTVAESCIFTRCTSDGDGGGIYSNSTKVVSGTFIECSAYYDGGGISSVDADGISCIFIECSAEGGGGICSVNANVTSCTFTDCYGTGYYSNGGGVCSDYYFGGTFLISSSSFTGCRANAGGAVYSELSDLTVASCNFTDCRGTDSGGAILSDTDGDRSATISSSTFANCSAGSVHGGGAFYANGTISTIHYCRIYDCNDGTAVVMEDGTLDAKNNWWGTNSDPSVYTAALSGGPVDVSPWLVLGTTASPSSITAGGSSTVKADLTRNSDGEDTYPGGYVPGGIPVNFSLTGGPGSLSSLSGVTASGISSTTYSSSSAGTATVAATVDGQTVDCNVIVNPGAGSSSSSGGSGGGPNSDTGIGFAQDLKAGDNVSFTMNKGSVFLVSFTAVTDIGKVMVTVEKKGSLPSSIDEPETDVYEYEEVMLYYAGNSDLPEKRFGFKVKKSWLTENGDTSGDIVMLHYNEETDEWEKLETTLADEDGAYYYYNAKTPSFSWFTISVSEGATVVPVETETAAITQAETSSATPSPSPAATVLSTAIPENPGPSGDTGLWSSFILPALAFALVIIVIIGLIGRRKKEQYPDWWDHGKK